MTARNNQQQPTSVLDPYRTPIVELPVDDSRRTVAYHSDPVGKAVAFLIKYAGLCVASGILSAGVVLYIDADAIAWLILMGAMTFAGWIVVAWMENQFSAEGIDRLRIREGAGVYALKIESERDVELERASAEVEQQNSQRLSAEIERLNLVIDSMRRDAMFAPQKHSNRLSNFVPTPAPLEHADPGPTMPPPPPAPPAQDEMKRELQRWVVAAYSQQWIAEDGRIVKGDTPWTVRGRLTPADKERARDWIKYAGHNAARWLVRYDESKRGWYINVRAYPTSGSMLAALDSVVPPK